MRLATWNLEKPRLGSWKKLPFLRERISASNADVWILTETNSQAIDLRTSHPHAAFTPRIEAYHSAGECWTAIHSRWPLERLTTSTPDVAVATRIVMPTGPLVVYGTVLPYHADRGPAGDARTWQEFHRVLPLQQADWQRLRAEHPDARFCLAGDLNQSLDGRHWNGRQWYGTNGTRTALRDAFAAADLTCVTAHDLIAAGHLQTRSNIDHICLDSAWARQPLTVGAWEPGRGDGVRLSDHNGVWVDA
jgi:hypothetical protein